MKYTSRILFGAFALLGLSSCIKEIESVGEMGDLILKVETKKPVANTRAAGDEVDTRNYPVYICREDGSTVQKYEKVTDVPARVQLPIGKYIIKAHTPGECPAKSYDPYYYGQDEVQVYIGENSQSKVECMMSNTRFDFRFGQEFKEAFSDWTITVDDGSGLGLTSAKNGTNREDGVNPDPVYVVLAEQTTALTVNYRATTAKDNQQVGGNYTIQKHMATEGYEDGDAKTFEGGDALQISFQPVASTEGQVVGITINADVEFNNTGEPVFIGVIDADAPEEDDPGTGGDTPGGGDEPGEDGAPYLETATWNVSYSVDDDVLPETNVKIFAPNGFASIIVKIEGGNAGFGAACDAMNFGDGVDLVNNVEFIGGLQDMDMNVEVPRTGDTEYSFPVGDFYDMMNMFGATANGKAHKFTLEVTDTKGLKTAQTLSVTIY